MRVVGLGIEGVQQLPSSFLSQFLRHALADEVHVACWCLSLSAPDPMPCFSFHPSYPPFSVCLQSVKHSEGDDSLSLGIDLDHYIDEVHHDRSVIIGQGVRRPRTLWEGQGREGRQGKENCDERQYHYMHAASTV